MQEIKYTEEGLALALAVEVCKVNIGTFIGWKKRYEATGDVKTKIDLPVNKKIIPENTPVRQHRTGLRVLNRTNSTTANIAFQGNVPPTKVSELV